MLSDLFYPIIAPFQRSIILICCLLFFLLSGWTQSATSTIQIEQETISFQDSTSILAYLNIYPNAPATTQLTDLSPTDFQSAANFNSLIENKNTHWLQFNLANPDTVAHEFILFVGYEQQVEIFVDNTRYYVGTLVADEEKIGNIKPGFFLRDEGYSGQIKLSLSAQEQKEIYIKTQRILNNPLQLNIKLFHTDFWQETMQASSRHFSQGIFQGIIWGFILFHLLYFLMVRDNTYLVYCAYMVCISVLTLGDFGYLQSVIFKNYPYLGWGVFLTIQYVAGIMTFVFMQRFVDLKNLMPKWDRRVTIFIWANVALIFAYIIFYIIFQDYRIVTAHKLIIAPFALLGFLFCILLIRSGDTVALYFAIAGAILSLGVTINAVLEVLEQRGLILETPYLRYYFLQIATSLHLLTFSIGMGYRSRQIDLAKQRAIELERVKTKLYNNITHEFRTPLTVILGITENIKGHLFEKQLIKKNGKNLLHLVNQILDLAKLEANQLTLNLHQDNIIPYLQYLLQSFQSLAVEKELTLVPYFELDKLVMDYDEIKIQQIVFNLLSNAIKFTPSDGKVIFHVSQNDDLLLLKIKDTGIGIAANKLPHIFDRFYQVDDTSTRKGEGTGIGLALTKELVELMQGEITVKSVLTKGTTFVVKLPITQNAPLKTTANTIKKESVTLPLYPSRITSSITNPTTEILIIEDNKDVILYLQSLLQSEYKIHTAVNGQDGIERAIELVPDLIISDVMMPEKDGYEVCATLKKDERTSHIPIVLLTAKATQEEKVRGLQDGADAYLTKPFDRAELFTRIEQLLKLRSNLQQRYSQSPVITTTKSLNREEQFLQKVHSQVLDKLTDINLSVANLAANLDLTNNQFYRKVKALSGKTPSQYIRQIRLQKSIELLRQGDLNISEVAYAVGFSDPNYFSRVFHQEFKQPPSAFQTGAS
ncbi:MAG: ATP-binding protein [Saprospiraceae bacterium]